MLLEAKVFALSRSTAKGVGGYMYETKNDNNTCIYVYTDVCTCSGDGVAGFLGPAFLFKSGGDYCR